MLRSCCRFPGKTCIQENTATRQAPCHFQYTSHWHVSSDPPPAQPPVNPRVTKEDISIPATMMRAAGKSDGEAKEDTKQAAFVYQQQNQRRVQAIMRTTLCKNRLPKHAFFNVEASVQGRRVNTSLKSVALAHWQH